MRHVFVWILVAATSLVAERAGAVSFVFSTGNPDGRMGMASRIPVGTETEIEAADDFVTTTPVSITGATVTGITPFFINVQQVSVAIYRVFPSDSDTVRVPNVPTRMNSPADEEFLTRDSAAGNMTFSTTVLSNFFLVSNSVRDGIHPSPNQTTGGDGATSGMEVQINLTFTEPILLDAGHYFFVPTVRMTSGDFYWLSAPKPIVAPGTPFSPDLQAWIRNSNLAPDWLRVGTDIVGGATPPTFNAAFSLSGTVVPFSPAHLWIGLKNSDDQGTRFDLLVEVLQNGAPVATGLERCITGVTRNPSKAIEAIVPFDSDTPAFDSGDLMALRVSTRIGTNPDGTRCGGHNNAVGLRLYYDSTDRPSRFDTTVFGPNENFYLRSDGNPCANAPSANVTLWVLDPAAPTATSAKCKDSGKVNFAGGNPFSQIGIWDFVVP